MKNVLIVTYWSYKDALIQTYTLPYVKMITKNIGLENTVYLVTLEQDKYAMSSSEWETEKTILKKQNINLIRFKYDRFGFKMIFRLISLIFSLIKLIKNKNINFIHCWCTPAGALGYFLSLITAKPLIIDSYEPHAESMVENRTWSKSSFKFKLLFWLEKKQSNRATTVIGLTNGMRNYALKKYNVQFQNYFVKPALVNLDKFDWSLDFYLKERQKKGLTDKIVGLYAGKIGGIYLEKEIFDFIKIASEHWKDNFKFYLLTSSNISLIKNYLKQNDIPEACIEVLFVDYSKIDYYFKISDFALNPVKSVPSKKYCTSIKDGEYWASGLPVIITKNISDDSDIIEKENIGYVLKELSKNEYQNACNHISTLIENRFETNNKIRPIAEKYRSYDIGEDIYKKIYN